VFFSLENVVTVDMFLMCIFVAILSENL